MLLSVRNWMVVLLAAVAVAGSAFADDVAVMHIRVGKDKGSRRVVFEFYEDAAPKTVANFKKLARKNFYNGTAFHRVFPHVMVQAGDPLSIHHDRSEVGTGGPGYTIPTETNGHLHLRGAVSAARLPDAINPMRLSNGSQFFIALTELPDYDGQYTVFGNVIEGMRTLDDISALPVDTNDNPIERVTIQSVQIVPREASRAVKAKRTGVMQLLRRVL